MCFEKVPKQGCVWTDDMTNEGYHLVKVRTRSKKSIGTTLLIDENSFNQRQNLWWDSFFTWIEQQWKKSKPLSLKGRRIFGLSSYTWSAIISHRLFFLGIKMLCEQFSNWTREDCPSDYIQKIQNIKVRGHLAMKLFVQQMIGNNQNF